MYGIILALPSVVFAQKETNYVVTEQQKSPFAAVAQIDKNDFAVPQMVDVPLSFENKNKSVALVVDGSGVIVPSTIITNTHYQPIRYAVKDSFSAEHANNMMDGAYETFTEFPFSEEQPEKNVVQIDVIADRSFTTDSIALQYGTYVTKPTHIRIASVSGDGVEHVVLPERYFNDNSISFPEENAKQYRITLKYDQPLRVSEITFTQKGVSQTVEQFVRFVAAPQKNYEIYFNVRDRVDVEYPESPNFDVKSVPRIIQPIAVTENATYKKSDMDHDSVIDRDDNCVDVHNDDQMDKDRNGVGDACEDFDHDDVINAHDNCADMPNHNQRDVDQDGVGDVCDGQESRFIEQNPWIPTAVLILVFVIVSMLIVKTLKKSDI